MNNFFSMLAVKKLSETVEKEKNANSKISDVLVLKFPKIVSTAMKICTLLIIVMITVMVFFLITDYDIELLYTTIFFVIFLILDIVVLYAVSKKMIIYSNKQFVVHSPFKKKQVYSLNDISKIKYKPNNALVFYSGNKKIFSIDYQFENFSIIYDMMQKSGISIN